MTSALRISDTQIQIDLPRAHGMRFSLIEARKLRDALNEALDQPLSTVKAMVTESVRVGRQQAAQSTLPYPTSGKIEAIKHLRSLTDLSLYDAKTLIEAAWNDAVATTPMDVIRAGWSNA